MKIRRGFVSNSSSSSFTMVTTRDNYDRIMDTLSDVHKRFMEVYGLKEKEMDGKDMVMISGQTGDYCSYEKVKPEDIADSPGQKKCNRCDKDYSSKDFKVCPYCGMNLKVTHDVCVSDVFYEIREAMKKSGDVMFTDFEF